LLAVVASGSQGREFDLRFVLLFFLFSSRGRNTRLVSDWSSDVCSSDLAPDGRAVEPRRTCLRARRDGVQQRGGHAVERVGLEARSEERRVGKEGRSRWSADDLKEAMNRTGDGTSASGRSSRTWDSAVAN